MPTYAFYAVSEDKRRADGCNTVIANGATPTAARTAAEALLGEPGALAAFVAVDLATAPALAIQGFPPVGGRLQTVWPTVDRGGNHLKGA